jgi:hypothetical protein
MQLVENLALRGSPAAFGLASHKFVDDRHEVLIDEPLTLLSRLPDIENAEDAGIVVEARGVDEQSIWTEITQSSGDGVIVARAAISWVDVDLLDEGHWHDVLLWSDVGS